jgi:hypothetical protein
MKKILILAALPIVSVCVFVFTQPHSSLPHSTVDSVLAKGNASSSNPTEKSRYHSNSALDNDIDNEKHQMLARAYEQAKAKSDAISAKIALNTSESDKDEIFEPWFNKR